MEAGVKFFLPQHRLLLSEERNRIVPLKSETFLAEIRPGLCPRSKGEREQAEDWEYFGEYFHDDSWLS